MLRKLTEDETRANWAYVRSRAKLYFWLAMLPGLALIWFAGYGYGMIDSCGATATRETISTKEQPK